MFYLFPLVWCLLLYLLSHEEKTLLVYEKLKKLIINLYWGKEVIENRKAIWGLVHDIDGTDFRYTLHADVISLLKAIKYQHGEDISSSIKSLKEAMEVELYSRCENRQLLVESCIQMILMTKMINLMSLGVDYFSEQGPIPLEYITLNVLLILPVVFLKYMYKFIYQRYLGKINSFRGKLWGLKVLGKTSICVSKVNSIIKIGNGKTSYLEDLPELRERVFEVLRRWNEFGEDPTERIDQILTQLELELSAKFRQLKKLSEGLKLFIMCVFYLLPYFALFFYKISRIIDSMT